MLNFEEKFKILTGTAGPFPWQVELFDKWFVKGRFPCSCNLPTGLGKTSVIAIWLIALIAQPNKIPRRLVYVVNRRTVVDQTTNEIERIRENLLKLKNLPDHARHLAISTLRGQFADNREWSSDPSRPAVICGTVDMIGSRLLFSGYGIGFKTKPLHAGFLGQDVLLVHDEAHLEPAFQTLLVEIQNEQKRCNEFGKFHVMELTATSRGNKADKEKLNLFTLTELEKKIPEIIPDPPTKPIHHVWRRQKARKAVRFHEIEDENKLADKISGLTLEHKDSDLAVLVFVRKLEDVEKISKTLPKNSTLQLTGTIRGLERDRLVATPIFQRFLPVSNRHENVIPTSGTVYLICTSAGEVGVNISADHLICDLNTFESMTQRFGRVNRFGDCNDTYIDIVYPKEFTKKNNGDSSKINELDQRRKKTLKLLKQLNGDASPAGLDQLDSVACRNAFAPSPTILPVTDILFDAWALTTIRGTLPGRPPVEPYLHGISDWQPPETHVAWREEVEVITDALLERYKPEELLEDYPIKPHELLRDRSDRAFKQLQKIAGEHPNAPVWIVDMRNNVEVTTLKKLSDGNKSAVNHMTVLLPPFVGGLTQTGMLDGTTVKKKSKVGEAAETNLTKNPLRFDVGDLLEDEKGPLRKRVWQGADNPDGMTLEREIKFENLEDEDAELTKVWRWFVRKPEAANERSRIAYPLHPHLDEVQDCASEIVGRLTLPHDIAKAVVLAAWFHDLGKHRERWQRSIGNHRYPNEVYAKSGRLPDGTLLRSRELLKDYRHEFGSILDLLDKKHPRHIELMKLSHDMQELVLHLIAAHHGRARPHFPMDEAFDPEHNQQVTLALAIEIPCRFARLQRKYGRWGLAYLESLVRAADYTASANPIGTIDVPSKTENQT